MTIFEKILIVEKDDNLKKKFKAWCGKKKIDYEVLKTKKTNEEIDEYIKSSFQFADEEFARWCSDHNTTWNDSNFFISKDVTTLSNCCFGADQEIYFFTKDGEKVLTTFGDFVNTRLKNKNVGDKVIEKLETNEKILDPNSGELRAIKAISKLKNPTNKLITIELEDGRTLKVTPDQKIYDNNSKTLVEAIEIVKNPEKYDI